MNQNRFACRMGSCLIVLCMIGFSGCVRSVYPILKDEQVIQDESLDGVWELVQESSESRDIFEMQPESTYKPDTDPIGPLGDGKVRQDNGIPKWGYRIRKRFEGDPRINFEYGYMRFGKIGSMTIAEYTQPMGEMKFGTNTPRENSMFLQLYTFALVEEMDKDRLILRPAAADWLAEYLAQHPDKLDVLPNQKDRVVIASKTDDLQKFLIEHANDEGFWGGALEFVRVKNPATQPDAATQPAGASSQPAR